MGNVIEGVSTPVTLNVSQRLLQVMEQVSYLKKDKVVEGYKAVTHDQVTGELRKWFVKYGLLIVPRLVSSNTVLTGTSTKNGAPYVRVEAVYDVSIISADNPSDQLCYSVLAHALDHGDKAPGKALSYAVKSVLLKACMIETGENDESRIVGEFSADDIISYEERASAAKTTEELHDIFNEMKQEAEQCGDRSAFRRLRAHIEKRRDEIKRAALMPSEKKGEPAPTPSAPPADASPPPEPAAKAPAKAAAPAKADTHAPASDSMKRMVESAMKRTGKLESQLTDKFSFTLATLPADQVNTVLAWARS